VRGRGPYRWAGVPPDERRAERRALLLEAAFDLLGSDGYAATTVRAVCQQARLNPRYFYESFADLDELVVAVFDAVMGELTSALTEAMAAARDEPESQTRAVVARIVRFVDEDRRRGRVLYVEGLGSEALNRRRRETGREVVELVVASAGADRSGRAGEQIGRASAAVLVGGFSQLLAEWLDGRIDLPRDQLAEDAADLFLALGDAAARIARRRAT
jgi:AcrR family transcriptional regulator